MIMEKDLVRNRIYDILMDDDVSLSIRNNLDELINYIPEIKDMVGFLHKHPHHHLDVFEHTLYALSLSEKIYKVRYALLLHDIGKPHSYTEGEVRHFTNHNVESEKISRIILNRLEYDQDFIDYVCYLIYYHDLPISRKDILEDYDKSYDRYLVQCCDALSHHPDKLEKRKIYLNKTLKKFEEFR